MGDLPDWLRTWQALGVLESHHVRNSYSQLVACYSEPHRYYHTQQHLAECFERLPEILALAAHPDEVKIALWFHDAIYDTHSPDNEKSSADWAVKVCGDFGVGSEPSHRIFDLIMFTRHAAEPVGADASVLVDIDLSILAASPERFAEYEAQIRTEYNWVSAPLFREKRAEVLREFLQREHIYSTATFRQCHESRARENLVKSLREFET